MRIKYTFIVLLMSLISCEDVIDIQPQDTIPTDRAIENIEDAEQALLGVYSIAGGYYNGDYFLTPDIMADHVRLAPDNLGGYTTEYTWAYQATGAGGNPQTNIWNDAYSTINRANVLLGRLDDIAGGVNVKNQIRGEALAWRAMAHFDLVRLYAQPYGATADASHLGIPVMLVSEISTPPRQTVSTVYNQVLQDLSEAKGLLNQNSPSKTRITQQAVTALMARVYLYQGNYQQAIASATEVINASSLVSLTDFPDMWINGEGENVNEVIFKLSEIPGVGTSLGQNLWRESTDQVSWKPSNQLLALYDPVNDVRYDTYFLIREPTDEGSDVIQKYQGNGDGIVDLILLRTAEMYLIRAEAYLETSQNDLAMADLNTLRANRIEGYDPNTPTLGTAALRNAIATERQKELAYEGHRWFDLRRTGEPVFRVGECDPCGPLEAGDFRRTWPIPQGEVFANPNIIQNENY